MLISPKEHDLTDKIYILTRILEVIMEIKDGIVSFLCKNSSVESEIKKKWKIEA